METLLIREAIRHYVRMKFEKTSFLDIPTTSTL